MHAILLCYRMPLSTYNYQVSLSVFSQKTLQEQPLPQQPHSQHYFAGQNKAVTWTGVNFSQKVQMGTQSAEVAGVAQSLQHQHQLADPLGERLWALVL